MRIILEGADNTGKSTLAQALARTFKLPVYTGLGPVKSELDFTARWLEYATREHGVFDRHFCISEPIYADFFDRGGKYYFDELVEEFYSERPVIVYCTPRTLEEHTASSPVDTPEYIAALKEKHDDIATRYDHWALVHADLFYTVGDDISALVVQIIDKDKQHARPHQGRVRFPSEVRIGL